MKFHPKALFVTAAAGVVLWLALNGRPEMGVGVSLAALIAFYAFEVLSLTGVFRGKSTNSD